MAIRVKPNNSSTANYSASEKKLSSKKDQNTYKYTSSLEIVLRNIKLHRFSKYTPNAITPKYKNYIIKTIFYHVQRKQIRNFW